MGCFNSTENVSRPPHVNSKTQITTTQKPYHHPPKGMSMKGPEMRASEHSKQALPPHAAVHPGVSLSAQSSQLPLQGHNLDRSGDPKVVLSKRTETASEKEAHRVAKEVRKAEKARKAQLNNERRRDKQARRQEQTKVETQKKSRQAQAKQKWIQQREQESGRTRTYPATSKTPFPGPEHLQPRNQEQNTYYSATWRTDFVNDEASGTYKHQNRTLTKADILRDLASAPPPSAKKTDGYPHVFNNYDDIFPTGSYVEYPIKGTEHIPHTYGQDFAWTDAHGKRTGPFRAVTNAHKAFVGVVAHTHPQSDQPGAFRRPRENHLGLPEPTPRAKTPRRRETGK